MIEYAAVVVLYLVFIAVLVAREQRAARARLDRTPGAGPLWVSRDS